MRDGETLQVNVEVQRSNATKYRKPPINTSKQMHSLRREVENVMRGGPNPFTKIPGVRKRDRANHDTSVVLGLL